MQIYSPIIIKLALGIIRRVAPTAVYPFVVRNLRATTQGRPYAR